MVMQPASRFNPGRMGRIEFYDMRWNFLMYWITEQVLQMFDVFDGHPEIKMKEINNEVLLNTVPNYLHFQISKLRIDCLRSNCHTTLSHEAREDGDQ